METTRQARSQKRPSRTEESINIRVQTGVLEAVDAIAAELYGEKVPPRTKTITAAILFGLAFMQHSQQPVSKVYELWETMEVP